MTPVDFPQVNASFAPPDGLQESQVHTIPGYIGMVEQGSVEGLQMIVVAWQPTAGELLQLNAGGRIYLTVLGGLPPHFLSTTFAEATNLS